MSLSFLRGHIRYFADSGFDVHVVSSTGAETAMVRNEGARFHEIATSRDIAFLHDLSTLLRFWRIIRRLRPHITNVGTPKAGLLGGMAAVLAGVPHRFYTLHGLRCETATGFRRELLLLAERLACRCAHSVLCVSPSLRERAVELDVVEREKTVVLPAAANGVQSQRFVPTPERLAAAAGLRVRLGIPAGAPVVGFVGRLTRDKGIVDLLHAYYLLRRTLPELRLLLVGDYEAGDPLPVETHRQIESDPQIVFTGFVPDTAPYYHLMDVFVLPTYREGFPNTVLEAQAAGKPVVTTYATGAVDSIENGITGSLVPVGDPAALADDVQHLLENPVVARAMGAAGAERVRACFRPELVWEDLQRHYRRALAKAPPRQRGLPLFIKSLSDRLAAAAGLLLLSPLVVATALAVWATMGRPVLFRQVRPGKNGRLFELLKFRTMTGERDNEGRLLPDAQRLTRLGRLLRASSLDELPQLWNVLKGDLSLVGPRPLLVEYLERYSTEQRRRHEVLPGITGWAQVNGRNALSWEEKFALDLWYVDNWSLGLDLKILVLTAWKTLRREGISQRGQATMPEFLGSEPREL